MRKLLIFAAFILGGCSTARIVETPSHSEYAPVNEGIRGVVKYRANRPDREATFKKMYKACGGPYRIVRESTQNEGTALIGFGGMPYAVQSNWVYITYECEI